MPRSRKFWVLTLLVVLGLVGAVLAATDTSIGPVVMHVHGRLAPWWDGALLTVCSLCATLFSLWWYWLPDWERPHASLRAVETVGGRRVPVLMFPYSTSLEAFLAVVGVMIATTSAIGNHLFLAFLGLPAVILLMRAVFGRQFIGLTADGLAWRVMPDGPKRGGVEPRGSDVTTRQPVQFLPWSAITGLSLADVVPAAPSAGPPVAARPFLALRVRVSDPSALAGLAHYQRIVPTASGADVLIPLDRHGPRERMSMFGEGLTRAEPETVFGAVDHYLRHPEERGQIGSPLGGARFSEVARKAGAGGVSSTMETVQILAQRELRAEARLVGERAAKTGQQIGGAVLGLPYFAVVLSLMFSRHVSEHATWFLPVTVGYLLLVVLPGSAALGAAIASFAAPTGHERDYSRASVLELVLPIVVIGVLTLSLSAWQYFDPANPGHSTISMPLILGAVVLTLLGLLLSHLAGWRVGLTAKAGRPAWLVRLLGLLMRSRL